MHHKNPNIPAAMVALLALRPLLLANFSFLSSRNFTDYQYVKLYNVLLHEYLHLF